MKKTLKSVFIAMFILLMAWTAVTRINRNFEAGFNKEEFPAARLTGLHPGKAYEVIKSTVVIGEHGVGVKLLEVKERETGVRFRAISLADREVKPGDMVVVQLMSFQESRTGWTKCLVAK